MLSSVPVDSAEGRVAIKLSASAMYRLEGQSAKWSDDGKDMGIADILAGLKNFSVTRFAHVLAECMNDGAGATVEDALALMDDIGFAKAMDAFETATEAAFPEASEKNAQRAGRKK